MTFPLISKELREHALPLLLLALLAVVSYSLIALHVILAADSRDWIEALHLFLLTMVVPISAALGNLLVVKEYRAKTQLFIEGLPISRFRMAATKFGLGLGMVLLLVGAAFLGSVSLARSMDSVPPRFQAILALRASSFTLCIHSFFFLMGFMGRYRIPVYLLLLILIELLVDASGWEVLHAGPFALLDSTFAHERSVAPAKALAETIGLSLFFISTAWAIALTREGSVAALLAEKMSHREKVLVSALLIAFLFSLATYSKKTEHKPFDLPEALVEEKEGLVVKVEVSPGGSGVKGREMARRVLEEILELKAYLELPALPQVFLVERRDLDPERFERGKLKEAEGLVVRANWGDDRFEKGPFFGWLVREILIDLSRERVKRESRMWVLDGFSLFWTRRARAGEPIDREGQILLRALHGTAEAELAEDLESWLRFRERVGEEIAAAVAWSGIETVARLKGPEPARRFLRGILALSPPRDLRATLQEKRFLWGRVLKQEAGLPRERFLEIWRGELDALRPRFESALARIPRLSGKVSSIPLSPSTRKVLYRLSIEPPSAPGRTSFLHKELSAFDSEVELRDVKRELLSPAGSLAGELLEPLSRGTRFYSTFAVEVEDLGCEVISGWTRREVE